MAAPWSNPREDEIVGVCDEIIYIYTSSYVYFLRREHLTAKVVEMIKSRFGWFSQEVGHGHVN